MRCTCGAYIFWWGKLRCLHFRDKARVYDQAELLKEEEAAEAARKLARCAIEAARRSVLAAQRESHRRRYELILEGERRRVEEKQQSYHILRLQQPVPDRNPVVLLSLEQDSQPWNFLFEAALEKALSIFSPMVRFLCTSFSSERIFHVENKIKLIFFDMRDFRCRRQVANKACVVG
jgi:hypothetical protein